MKNESDTPEIDIAWNQCCDDDERLYMMKHKAEDLERERNRLQIRLEECDKCLATAIREIDYLKANPGKP